MPLLKYEEVRDRYVEAPVVFLLLSKWPWVSHNQCLHFVADEHPCTTCFDVHHNYGVLIHSQSKQTKAGQFPEIYASGSMRAPKRNGYVSIGSQMQRLTGGTSHPFALEPDLRGWWVRKFLPFKGPGPEGRVFHRDASSVGDLKPPRSWVFHVREATSG